MDTSGLTLIAEAATCHGGNLMLAKRMALAAKEALATHVKYQHVDPDHFPAGSPAREWYSRVQFTAGQLRELKAYCEGLGIKFLCTPQTVQDFHDLVSIGIEEVKISSDNAENRELIDAIEAWGGPTYVSSVGIPPISTHTVLICTPSYPCPPDKADLLRIGWRWWMGPVGFSDHTIGHEAALIALGLGARTFEKHFRLADVNPFFCGPDAVVSCTETELQTYFQMLQRGLTMLGTGWPE